MTWPERQFDGLVSVLESHIAELREVCAGLPDRRKAPGDGVYTMADIGLSAFSVFSWGLPFVPGPSAGAGGGHGRSNCQTLFGMTAIPTDPYIRG